MDNGEEALVVLRCGACGDTFPSDDAENARCPSCGATEVEQATEPLL
jgi:rRNA maturation endonuclease Nob1